MIKIERQKTEKCFGFGRLLILCLMWMLCLTQTALASETMKIEYYYEEVCASCDGTKDFFELYNRIMTAEDKQNYQVEIATYNVFMDSCKERYVSVQDELDIPSGTSLPVLVVGDQWISGHEQIETQLHDVLMNQKKVLHEKESETSAETAAETAAAHFWETIKCELQEAEHSAVVLFSTTNCEDCEAVKAWLTEQGSDWNGLILEYNIIEQECLNELKAVFKQYQVPEEQQKVPAVFFGKQYRTGREEITSLTLDMMQKEADNEVLADMLRKAETNLKGNVDTESMNLWTLAAAGLLAGFNPCSISMLLMLMSLLLSEKASIWKSGILYLLGKYAAYISIGFAIFVTASQISEQTMETVGNVMNVAMGILFAVASVLYIIDAVRVYRQDYGKIRMQLPVGLRRMNHNLIKKVSSAGGVMQPLMVLMLGIVISFGEFFCTGQIYMASITYMLKDQMKAAVLPFLVYTTAMSIPAVIMIVLIQRTRNTDAVSDFIFRHLGVIKILNAVLFALFALYFLIF